MFELLLYMVLCLYIYIYIYIIVSRIIDYYHVYVYIIMYQEEHKKLEVLAFESETRIASLEEEITATLKEKEEVMSINEGLMVELEGLCEKLNTSTTELNHLKEEIDALVSFFRKFS